MSHTFRVHSHSYSFVDLNKKNQSDFNSQFLMFEIIEPLNQTHNNI